jgi:ABC-type nitrate/sulfonate/bicarbonate transport system ATPase subunit
MSGRPGTIEQVYDVPLPRPRSVGTLQSADFHRLVDDITAALFRVMPEAG